MINRNVMKYVICLAAGVLACDGPREGDGGATSGGGRAAAKDERSIGAPGRPTGTVGFGGTGGGGGGGGGARGQANTDMAVAEAQPPSPVPQPGTPAAAVQGSDSIAAAMLIRTGQATVEVESVDTAITRVRALATRLGGFIANESAAGGKEQPRFAMLEMRIPARRFNEAIGGLAPLGRVESVNVETQDVGEEYVDLVARMDNSRRLEARLIDLLRTRTGKLQDVLAVERELARVREEIERMEGRARFLRARVATSTLIVNLREPRPILGTGPGEQPIRSAFRGAWRNFIGFVATFIEWLGVLIPLGVLVAIAWVVVRRIRQGRHTATDD